MMAFGSRAREGRLEIPIRAHQRLQMVSTQDIGAFAARAFERRGEYLGAAFDLEGQRFSPRA